MQSNSVLIAIFFILPTIKSDQSIDRLCAHLNGSNRLNDTTFFDGRFTQFQDHFDPQNEIRWQQRVFCLPANVGIWWSHPDLYGSRTSFDKVLFSDPLSNALPKSSTAFELDGNIGITGKVSRNNTGNHFQTSAAFFER